MSRAEAVVVAGAAALLLAVIVAAAVAGPPASIEAPAPAGSTPGPTRYLVSAPVP